MQCLCIILLVIWTQAITVSASETLANTVIMVSPDSFRYNHETAQTNTFQHHLSVDVTTPKREFEHMVALLRQAGINVITLASRSDIETPDAVFVNNWFTLHMRSGQRTLVVYPMYHTNRRPERQVDALKKALAQHGMPVEHVINLTQYEAKNKALEGTGSLVLDKQHGIAYAALSERTDPDLVKLWCRKLGYRPVIFRAFEGVGRPIYHTNVMMSIGQNYTILCTQCIQNEEERKEVLQQLHSAGKEVIEMTPDQVPYMTGNLLQLANAQGQRYILLSRTAADRLTPAQQKALQRHGTFLVAHIHAIETIGGGSARCMVAEAF
jgi:hypothetical protein